MVTGQTASAERCQPLKRRRGGAAIEFALVLPLLVLCVLGVVDFARVYATTLSLRNAARAGAEQAATHRLTPLTQTAWEQRIRAAVLDEIQSAPQFDPVRLITGWTAVTNAHGQLAIEVTTQYPFQTIVSWPGIPQSITLRASVVMEQFR